MRMLDLHQLKSLARAEEATPRTPIPTRIVSSDEYLPVPQTAQQREVEARLSDLADALAARHGVSRRRFFQTAAGMAASYLAMNQVYGPLFEVAAAEPVDPQLAEQRAQALKSQMVFDAHTHFLRDDVATHRLLGQRSAVGQLGWNAALAGRQPAIEDLRLESYLKEIYLDSDTRVALLTNAPADDPRDWLLPQEQVFITRDRVNREAGSRRMLAHFTITPGQPGWLDQVDRAIEVHRPDGWKAYTVGDFGRMDRSAHPFRLDDERLMYPFYERAQKSGIRNVCVHKGLFTTAAEKQFPHLRRYVDVSDVGKAARDWPELNFVIYHSGFRHVGAWPVDGLDEWERNGRLPWTSELAEIPATHGVRNVYGDLGAIFAWTVIGQPRLAAALLGTLIKGLGHDHVIWGTDSVWTGSPQWQIEALRRLEIPEDMRARHGFAPLGSGDGAIKSAILGDNGLRLFNYPRRAGLMVPDRFTSVKQAYEDSGAARSNLRYGYVSRD